MDAGYALFDTSLGRCAIAWGPAGIRCLQLPEERDELLVARLADKAGGPLQLGEAPAFVKEAVERIARHLAGSPQDLSDIPLDLAPLPPFHRRVVEAARRVPAGQVVTYGELAERAGSPGAARAVGQAMATNRFPIVVPCHRVLAAGRKAGGFSAYGGLTTKERLLALEGVALRRQGSLFDGDGALPFEPVRAVRALKQADEKLAALIDRVGPFRLKPEGMSSPFEALAEAIVYQQLSGKAAATILGRFKGLFGGRFPQPGEVLAASEERLRSAGLSGPKQRALRDLSAKALDGVVPTLEVLAALSDEEIVERLTAVRGVGRWTVEMLLLFRLARPDVLPTTDYGIRKGFALMLGKRSLPEPEQIARRGERWRPFRSVASWYLWRALEL